LVQVEILSGVVSIGWKHTPTIGFWTPGGVIDWMKACHQKVNFGSFGASFDWMEAYTKHGFLSA
jgi:hypothetical protein